ncbi:MAG: hypothetical protein QG675_501 [Patescibacteria group bacterium]|nr:hypothetical protein [Patescibacteria group bacterium]
MNEPIPTSEEPITEIEQSYVVRELRLTDVPQVEQIARQWVRFPPETGPVIEEEVQEMIELMQESIKLQNNRHYFVSTDKAENVVGFVCLADLEPKMQQFSTTENPIELKNLYVQQGKRRGKGVGSALYNFAKDWSRAKGYTEIILNSGPRYKKTGWPFYQIIIGDPIGMLKDFYGPGNGAPVWREDL